MKRAIAKIRRAITGKCPRCQDKGHVMSYRFNAYGIVPCKVCK